MLCRVARGGGVNEAQVARTNAARRSMAAAEVLSDVLLRCRSPPLALQHRRLRQMSSSSDAYADLYDAYGRVCAAALDCYSKMSLCEKSSVESLDGRRAGRERPEQKSEDEA